jgi:predicted nuclease with TOPRIM domain
MSKWDEPRKFLVRPAVIDWLQYGEFRDKIGDPDYPQLALSLIAEYKNEVEQLQQQNAELKYKKKYLISGYETMLDELKKENEEYKSANLRLPHAYDDLKTKLDKAVEALKEIKFHEDKYISNSPENNTLYLTITNEALKEIGVE